MIDNEQTTENIKNKIKLLNEKCVNPQLKGEDTLKYKNIKITKRNDNRWQARFLENGNYKYVYDKTQQGCYNKLKEILKDKKVIVKSNTLNSWITKWIQIYKVNKVKESTLYQINAIVKRYVTNSKLGNKDITKIQLIDIECFLNDIDKTRQRQKVYIYLSDIFNKAYKNKIVKENIMINVQKPNHIKKQSKAFTREEQKLFVKECNQSKYGNCFLILLYQGFRIGELLALNFTDINLKKNVISISKTINDLGNTSTPKTQSSIREVPIFNETRKILNKLNNSTNKIFDYKLNACEKEFKRIVKRLNLEDFTIHSLRHTFVTRWIELGAPTKLVQKWVGHSTNNITEQVYTQINNDFENDFIQKKQDDFNICFDTDFDTEF